MAYLGTIFIKLQHLWITAMADKDIVSFKWVYKLKQDSEGNIVKIQDKIKA